MKPQNECSVGIPLVLEESWSKVSLQHSSIDMQLIMTLLNYLLRQFSFLLIAITVKAQIKLIINLSHYWINCTVELSPGRKLMPVCGHVWRALLCFPFCIGFVLTGGNHAMHGPGCHQIIKKWRPRCRYCFLKEVRGMVVEVQKYYDNKTWNRKLPWEKFVSTSEHKSFEN